MKAYIAFTKKEFVENLRTYKIFIMAIVFLLLGMMNPIIAKFMPALFESAMPEGMIINIPDPTMFDSWIQFFSTIGQMGLLALVIVFSGSMANELSRDTLVNMLTKGLKRSTVILSKLTMATIIWTLCFILSFIVSYVYTAYFWDMEGMHHIFITFFSLWLFGMLLISLVILGGVLFKSIYGSLLLCGGAVMTMMLLNINPSFQKYNPITLSSDNMSLLTAQKTLSEFMPAIIVCAILVILCIIISILSFNKKQI